MKKILTLSALAVTAIITGCGSKTENSAQDKAANTEQQTVNLEKMTFEERASYVIGINMGENLDAYLSNQNELTFNREQVAAGVSDALNKKQTLSKEQMTQVFEEIEQKSEEMRKEQLAKAEQTAKDNLEASAKFLEENAKKPGIVTTESGLQYKIEKMGDGPKPAAEDIVKVHYTGKFLDGETFDSSVERGQPSEFAVNQVIPGWVEGLQLMPKGSKFHFYIPAKLGYGEKGVGKIPGNALLEFEVELLDVTKAQAEPATNAPEQTNEAS